MNVQVLEKKFRPYLQHPVFLETLHLVQRNSHGKIWLFGGFLYRNLAYCLYGGVEYSYDIDFLVEQRTESIVPFPGWNIETNSYGNQNYVRAYNRMSFTGLQQVSKANGLHHYTIAEIIDRTPLTIQSIAWDITGGALIGYKGIVSLCERIIRVNNRPPLEEYAKKKSLNPEDIVEKKAQELGFRYSMV